MAMQKNFNFSIPLKKDISDPDRLVGLASTISIDRDEERMSLKALNEMTEDIRTKGVNLFGDHEHGWTNILGGIDQADLRGDELFIGINPNKSNPLYPQLIGTMSTKGVTVGLSVGGTVTKEKYEYDAELGKKVKVIDGVKLYEISVVGIPSNPDAFVSIPGQIAKSMKTEEEKSKDKPNIPKPTDEDKEEELAGKLGNRVPKKEVKKGAKEDIARWISAGKTKAEIVQRLVDGYGMNEKEASDKYTDATMTSVVGKALNISNEVKCLCCNNSLTKGHCDLCGYNMTNTIEKAKKEADKKTLPIL